jgi:hypothetical protein
MITVMVIIQVVFAVGLYIIGYTANEVLFEGTSWNISDSEYMGCMPVLVDIMYWLIRAYKALAKKIKEV